MKIASATGPSVNCVPLPGVSVKDSSSLSRCTGIRIRFRLRRPGTIAGLGRFCCCSSEHDLPRCLWNNHRTIGSQAAFLLVVGNFAQFFLGIVDNERSIGNRHVGNVRRQVHVVPGDGQNHVFGEIHGRFLEQRVVIGMVVALGVQRFHFRKPGDKKVVLRLIRDDRFLLKWDGLRVLVGKRKRLRGNPSFVFGHDRPRLSSQPYHYGLIKVELHLPHPISRNRIQTKCQLVRHGHRMGFQLSFT